MLKRKTVKIGDVVQILSSEGVAYGQVTHIHTKWGHLLRIFPSFYKKGPSDFTEVVTQEPQFSTFFLVQDAVAEGLIALVANVDVASHNQAFPIFRNTNNPGEGTETLWFFWDGEREWPVERLLTNEEKKYPKKSLPSAPLLVDMIEIGYRPENDYS